VLPWYSHVLTDDRGHHLSSPFNTMVQAPPKSLVSCSAVR
jgi:hypothetical protein